MSCVCMQEPKCIRFLYDAPSNLALSKRVTQSSTMGSGRPELAVDGRLLPTKPSACTCTKGDQNSWWTVRAPTTTDRSPSHDRPCSG